MVLLDKSNVSDFEYFSQIIELTTYMLQDTVTVIILNWNGRLNTLQCLRSVRNVDYQGLVTIVVDNGSFDGSVEAIRNEFPDVLIIETGSNLGYAGGNNVGIRYAIDQGAKYALILNNDTIVDSDFIVQLVAAAESHVDCAFLSPRIYDADSPNTIYYDGGLWNSQRQVVEFINKGKHESEIDNNSTKETTIIHGCALLFPISVVSSIGLLDERYFLLFEETDWSFRARKAGFRNYVVPMAKIWHVGAASFGGRNSPLRHYFHMRNYLLFAECHLGKINFIRLLSARVFKDLFSGNPRSLDDGFTANWRRRYWNLVKALLLWKGRHSNPVFYAKLLGFRDYLLRRFGDCPDEVRSL